jgi:hypothetical protein
MNYKRSISRSNNLATDSSIDKRIKNDIKPLKKKKFSITGPKEHDRTASKEDVKQIINNSHTQSTPNQ